MWNDSPRRGTYSIMDSVVSAGLARPPVLSRVRRLSADSIVFLCNQQLVDYDMQLVLRQWPKDTDTTHRE